MAQKGYHILLEKPMAITEEDCRAIVAAVKAILLSCGCEGITSSGCMQAAGVLFAVGHVLRYTPYNQKIIEILRVSLQELIVGVLDDSIRCRAVGWGRW
jgi:predicted dehydrogenase